MERYSRGLPAFRPRRDPRPRRRRLEALSSAPADPITHHCAIGTSTSAWTGLARRCDWSGGTRIGEAIRSFNYHWARRTLGRGAVCRHQQRVGPRRRDPACGRSRPATTIGLPPDLAQSAGRRRRRRAQPARYGSRIRLRRPAARPKPGGPGAVGRNPLPPALGAARAGQHPHQPPVDSRHGTSRAACGQGREQSSCGRSPGPMGTAIGDSRRDRGRSLADTTAGTGVFMSRQGHRPKMCAVLFASKTVRSQAAKRSTSRIPAIRAIRSSSPGVTNRQTIGLNAAPLVT